MGLFEHFPYTNFHDLNLDVILKRVKDAEAAAAESAEDAAGSQAHADEALTKATTALNTANTAASNASTALSTANTAASNASTALSTANTAASDAATAVTSAAASASSAESAATSAAASATSAESAATSAAASAEAATDAAAATGVRVYDIKYDSATDKYLAQLPDSSQATLDEFLTRIVDGTCKVRFGIDKTDLMTDAMIQLFKSPGVDRYIAVFRLIANTGPANTRRLYEYSTTIYLDTTPAYYTPINEANMFNIAVTNA